MIRNGTMLILRASQPLPLPPTATLSPCSPLEGPAEVEADPA